MWQHISFFTILQHDEYQRRGNRQRFADTDTYGRERIQHLGREIFNNFDGAKGCVALHCCFLHECLVHKGDHLTQGSWVPENGDPTFQEELISKNMYLVDSPILVKQLKLELTHYPDKNLKD